jgi:hypothetical protein
VRVACHGTEWQQSSNLPNAKGLTTHDHDWHHACVNVWGAAACESKQLTSPMHRRQPSIFFFNFVWGED